MDFATWWVSRLKFGPVTELSQETNSQFEMWAPLAKVGFPKDILKNTHSQDVSKADRKKLLRLRPVENAIIKRDWQISSLQDSSETFSGK